MQFSNRNACSRGLIAGVVTVSLVAAACVSGGREGASSSVAATSGPNTTAAAASVPSLPATSPEVVGRLQPETAPPVSSEADRVLSGEVTLAQGFVVPAGEVWAFDPEVSTTVEVGANVIVEGTLVMRPARPAVKHTLRFVGVDESRFVGGGMDVVDSDTGLWVVGAGRLDLHGAPKVAWAYEWQPGWEGDEVVASPTAADDYDTFVAVDSPDDVPPPNALGREPELLNLTRNVVIEGTAQGRAHVLIRSTQPQQIMYATFRHLGPLIRNEEARRRDRDSTGRYPLHFHHGGDGSRGSIVEGVVVTDAGNHAFVTHASHGVTLRDTIAYNTVGTAYWWDPTTRVNRGNESHDVTYERVVAARVSEGGGFQLGEGTGNSVVGSVAVAAPNDNSAGGSYMWLGPEDGVWRFEGNVAHNSVGAGIFVWVNSPTTHVIEDFTAYHNAKPGISHGAYRNSYVYENVTLLDNDQQRDTGVAVEAHAVGRPAADGGTDTQVWQGITTGGAALRTAKHAQDPLAPVRFIDCDFSTIIVGEGPGHPSLFEFIDCGLGPEDVEIVFMHPDSVLRFQNGDEAVELDGSGAITPIPPFYTP